MDKRERLTDEELLRRLSGHLKPVLAPHLLHEAKPEARYTMGVFWLALFLGIMGFLWSTILYPIHYIITWLVFSAIQSLDFFNFFSMLFGEATMQLNGPVNNLIFTLEFMGTYLFAVFRLIVHAGRTTAQEDILPHGGVRLTIRGYLRMFLALFTYLPHLGLVCFGLAQASEGEAFSAGGNQLSAYSRICLVIAESDTPLSMESLWKLIAARFSDAFPGGENQAKALLLRLLRDLSEARLVEEQRFEQDQISDRTRYRAGETLTALLSRCRLSPSVAETACSTAQKNVQPDPVSKAQPRRPEPPPDIANPESSVRQTPERK